MDAIQMVLVSVLVLAAPVMFVGAVVWMLVRDWVQRQRGRRALRRRGFEVIPRSQSRPT